MQARAVRAMDDIRKYKLSDMDKMGILKSVKVFIFYELQPSIDPDNLISSIIEGVENASRQLPFMAGKFKVDDGELCIVTTPGSRIQVSTRRFESTEHKSLSLLAKDSFPPNDLDLAQFLPEEPAAERNPACALQLSLVEGGLVLGFSMNHAAGDWSSIDTFLSLVCRSCKAHREGLKMPTYIPDLNRAPYNASATDPAIARQDLLERLPTFRVVEKSQVKAKPSPPSRSSLYRVSEPSIQQLKAHCAPYLSGVDYITSYDCISALLWISITRVRIHLHPEKASSPSRFVHPIDVRTRDLEHKSSEQYFGNAVIGTQAGPLTASDLVSDGDRSVAKAASLIRQSVHAVNLSSISCMAAIIASLSPTETLVPYADFTDMDMFMNTWYSGSAEKYDLGPASVPVAFRMHSAMAGACLMILPNFSQGAARVFDVLVHLSIEEHELLRKDEEFSKHFEFVA